MESAVSSHIRAQLVVHQHKPIADATMTASWGPVDKACIRRVSVNTESKTTRSPAWNWNLSWSRSHDIDVGTAADNRTCVAPGRVDHFLPIKIPFHCLVRHLSRITKIGMESVAERNTGAMRAIPLFTTEN